MPEVFHLPWFAWIVIIGMLVGGVIAVAKLLSERNDTVARALEQNTAVNEAVLARLEGIDGRLGRLEKTLDDIPS